MSTGREERGEDLLDSLVRSTYLYGAHLTAGLGTLGGFGGFAKQTEAALSLSEVPSLLPVTKHPSGAR